MKTTELLVSLHAVAWMLGLTDVTLLEEGLWQ